jgi:hypothetical protein
MRPRRRHVCLDLPRCASNLSVTMGHAAALGMMSTAPATLEQGWPLPHRHHGDACLWTPWQLQDGIHARGLLPLLFLSLAQCARRKVGRCEPGRGAWSLLTVANCRSNDAACSDADGRKAGAIK